jgi:hypothetical protein
MGWNDERRYYVAESWRVNIYLDKDYFMINKHDSYKIKKLKKVMTYLKRNNIESLPVFIVSSSNAIGCNTERPYLLLIGKVLGCGHSAICTWAPGGGKDYRPLGVPKPQDGLR